MIKSLSDEGLVKVLNGFPDIILPPLTEAHSLTMWKTRRVIAAFIWA